jgi:2,3-dihydroxy-2,3-dihydrophenylpropionate dehydrogenase
MGWLDGKVALLTGGGSGIGRGVVERFVAEGAKVGVLEISAEKAKDLRSQLGDSVVVIEGDGTSMADNERAVSETVEAFGPLDSLVCCVGVFDYFTEIPALPAEKIDEAFDELFGVNVKSYLMATKAALDQLIASEGNITFTVSNAGFYPGGGGPLYVSSKFAVRGLITELAYELAPKVRVNGVAPGGTITELRGIKALEQQGQALKDVPDIGGLIENINPLGVVAYPEDHAWSYVFLASKERTKAITGTIIHADGGLGVRGMTRLAGLAE